MAKRKETIEIENALHNICRDKIKYGCEEVTIGFYNNGHGDEVVDFMTMDSKGIITCYEIKVTLQDLKSNAKMSWYRHKNYLVVSAELYNKVYDWSEYLPGDVGLICYGNLKSPYFKYLNNVFNCKKRNISAEDNVMLKESLIRSMFYKMNKYKDAADIEKYKELNKEIRLWKKRCEDESKEKLRLLHCDHKLYEMNKYLKTFLADCKDSDDKKYAYEFLLEILREK